MKLKNIIPLVAIVAFFGFMTRLAIGLTVNERYEDAVETLKDKGQYYIVIETNTAIYTTPSELEQQTISALKEVSKRHNVTLYTI